MPDIGSAPPATADDFYAIVKTAVEAGDLDEVKSQLSQWRTNSATDGPSQEHINYLVPRAAQGQGQPEVLEYLLSIGANIGTHSVSLATSPVIFRIFVAHGWEIDSSLLLSHVRHPELIAFFLSQGANPNAVGSRGFCALDIAALHGPLETVRLLLDHGATIRPESGAMHAAAQGDAPNRIPIMAYLLERGADINGIAVDYPAPSEAMRSGRKGTPLHTAAKWGNDEAKAWLLEHGADAEAKNDLGETPDQWGKRFDRDGPERGLRLRRAINRKNQAEKG
ncbi:MAG: hypothetical protein Q9190_007539 [Brigantiaea leucoxantha]